ncbi:MAG: glucose-methanol-choline oxidoreductase [Schlesneria sp.]|nr:glucose-methanol-choline oxidoreductase [Schlesneria sp.]
MQAESDDQKKFDVIIVGGGVCGALAAKKISAAGKSVLLLEAGTKEAMDPGQYDSFISRYYTMGATRGSPNGPYPPNNSALSPNDSNQDPYFVQVGPQQFLSDYLRMLGGTTLHWQGTSLRMLPVDFEMQTAYGRGTNWPITYDHLERFYREAEWEIGICANVEEQANLGVRFPPDYVYPMEKMPQSLVDQFFMRKLDHAEVDLFGKPYPLKVVSMPVARNATPNLRATGYTPVGSTADESVGQRCQGNSSCSPLCPVQAKYNALKTLAAALKTKDTHLEIRSQCVASKLRVNACSGRVTGVEYKEYSVRGKAEYTAKFVEGKVVVLAANAIENAVLMLASGVVDDSGQLGRNLMDHPFVVLRGLAPEPVYPFRGPDITSGVESLRDGRFREKHAAFRAGISNWGWVGEPTGSVESLIGRSQFGKAFREQLCDRMSRMVRLGVMIEQLPDADNRVTIDPARTDILGNYLPVLNYKYDDYSLDAAVAAIRTVWPTIVKHAGIEDTTDFSSVPGGSQSVFQQGLRFNVTGSGHLVGTHRMGHSADSSVVDTELRSWAHGNLYVIGSGSMVTIGTSNPTLTAAALSLRAAENILKTWRE